MSTLKLSGVCDCFDPSIDHLQEIGMMIAAANTAKAGKVGSGPIDEWTLDEPNSRLIQRVKSWRKKGFGNACPIEATDRRKNYLQGVW